MSDLSSKTFESALKELEALISQLEDGRITLEEAVHAYEKGLALKAHCEEKLRLARMRIEKVSVGTNGEVKLEPIETESAESKIS